MALPVALTSALTDLALNSAAIASLIVVARFAVFGVVFVGTPLEVFRGEDDDEDYAADKKSSELYVLPALDKKEFKEPSWETAGGAMVEPEEFGHEDAANDEWGEAANDSSWR